MTVREINRLTIIGKPVIAIYVLDGLEKQGRIIRARMKASILQVKTLGSGRWATLKSDESVWKA